MVNEQAPAKPDSRGRLIIRVPGSLLYRAFTCSFFAAALLVTGVVERAYGGVIAGASLLAFAARTFAIRAIADDSGVDVRNSFRSYRFSWDKVVNITVVETPFVWVLAMVGLKRRRVVVTKTDTGAIAIHATQSIDWGAPQLSFFSESATHHWSRQLERRWRTMKAGESNS